jgi:hypothetical protein
MLTTEALQVCLEVAAVLDGLDVPYLVGGSLASSFHGFPRATNDADLVADLRDEHVAPFVAALAGRYYVDEERVRHAVGRRSSFNVIQLATMFKVDVFVLGDEPQDREEMARRTRIELPDGGGELEVASAEDTILQKLHWYRLGRGVSDRQWQDVLAVLRVQAGRLDRSYLLRGAEALGVSDLLEQAASEAG